MRNQVRGYAHRVDVVADVLQVWQALTEAEHLTRWCAPGAQIRAGQGGVFRASVDRVTELEAHIDIFEPGRRLRLIYLPSNSLPPTDNAIVDDFILESLAPGTVLRLLGSGMPATAQWETQYRRMRLGWQQAIARLKVLVERQVADAARLASGG
jgi:uncharacterized protein YndB with AHSA1/START domain